MATDAEISKRILVVYDLLLQSKSRQKILQMGSKAWNITDRQIDTYISRATEMIKNEVNSDKSIVRSSVLASQVKLYELAVGKGDLETARKILSDFAKLQGIDAAEKIEINATNTNYNQDVSKQTTDSLLSIVNKKKKA